MKVVQAKHEPDTQKAIDIVVEATEQLLERVQSATNAGFEEYFKQVQIPKTSPS